ncbi:AraC family transcriptional regulator [Leptospira sp. GIMC2001]|uniref:AraC family transcriptional regulator n=1 Tax=Leptospira sp. GIMC2001 TaxID=1513297 RepID=UPI00234919C3|nr:helix-turn-helix domain-containing protein [Leptospira sp. GIMC2001]WCL49735.1 helix-turn-helix domain-containing protein [Leptospira sp. GIMC2001]
MEAGFFHYLSFFGSGVALLFSLGYAITPISSTKNRQLSFALLLVGIFLAHTFYISSNIFQSFPYLYCLHLPILFLFGPILARLFYLFLEGEVPYWLESRLHYIPFVLGILFYLPSSLLPIVGDPDRFHRLMIADVTRRIDLPIKLLSFLGCLSLMMYILHSAFHFLHIFRLSNLWRTPAVRFFLIILLLASFGTIGGFIISLGYVRIGIGIGMSFLASIVPALYLIQSFYPSLFQDVKIAIEEEKYRISHLKNLDINEVTERINKLFSVEKIYLEDELNLSIVAEKLNITTHQLSEFLNQVEKKSFNQYVNSHRIEYACKSLIQNPEWPTIRIAYDSGFQSKSSFHDAFRREMNMTPTAYRKKNSPE